MNLNRIFIYLKIYTENRREAIKFSHEKPKRDSVNRLEFSASSSLFSFCPLRMMMMMTTMQD
jgi:hypothetical protein